MPESGQKATTGGLIETARFRGCSSRPMSAFSADGDFVPRLPAHLWRADAPTDPSFGQHLARSGHRDAGGWEPFAASGAAIAVRSLDPVGRLGYLTSVEQQGVALDTFDARRDQAFWRSLRDLIPKWDALIDAFNAEISVSEAR
jgi:hypothetical protein